MNKIRVVLVTSGQPALNPRLVKEADTLTEMGYSVTVVYLYWNAWGTREDEELLSNKKWKAIRVGGSPKVGRLTYYFSKALHKLGQALAKNISFKYKFSELAIRRGTLNLINSVKKNPADLYIAHNLPALPAAVIAAKKNGSRCGFDAEDFHRNEATNNTFDFNVRINTFIEDKYFPSLNYITVSSELIAEAYKNLYPNIQPLTILNVFPRKEIPPKKSITNSPLKLFWFSQTIGKNRGLEHIVNAMAELSNVSYELHLLGNHDEEIKQYLDHLLIVKGTNKSSIFYYEPIHPDGILEFAQQFDIGLATELKVPLNRDLCLTNKIFTYVQSGLAIIASDTKAQKKLMLKYPQMGLMYNEENLETLIHALRILNDERSQLAEYQQHTKKYADLNLNWEVESKKFANLIEKVLLENE